MPEGDTIAYAAMRIRPVLEGRVPDEIRTPQFRHAMDRWPQRLAEPCPRRGTTIRARGQGDDNRTTFWCPGCQR